MRTFVSAVLGLVAVVLAAGAFCGAWLNTNVVSEDGFAALGEPLAEDASFQQELAIGLAEEATAAVNLPEQLAGFVQPAITSAVEGVQALPDYPQAWNESLHHSHALTFQDAGGSGEVMLDVGPLVGLVTGTVGSDLGADIPAPEQVTVQVGGTGHPELIRNLQRAGEAWPVLGLAAAAAGILALLVARRRSTTFALMGLGVLAAGAGLWLAAGMVPDRVAEQASGSSIGPAFARAFASEAAANLQSWTLGLMVGGAAVLVVGLLARVLRGSRR